MNNFKPDPQKLQAAKEIIESASPLAYKLKDWSLRTRSDVNALAQNLKDGNYETAKANASDILNNLDELDKIKWANTPEEK